MRMPSQKCDTLTSPVPEESRVRQQRSAWWSVRCVRPNSKRSSKKSSFVSKPSASESNMVNSDRAAASWRSSQMMTPGTSDEMAMWLWASGRSPTAGPPARASPDVTPPELEITLAGTGPIRPPTPPVNWLAPAPEPEADPAKAPPVAPAPGPATGDAGAEEPGEVGPTPAEDTDDVGPNKSPEGLGSPVPRKLPPSSTVTYRQGKVPLRRLASEPTHVPPAFFLWIITTSPRRKPRAPSS
ncbi:hypothetical protein H696_03878 [Fonticula alba]|uniref:Uncharacterized protein n=1 Tax=Fonticula alba TaxID=691883 RepID=A0A058Z5B3_FONAL|nr:hypothetical protein H696_03878 [Fonticula alba]KCV69449.1 hypothetical protein H696_03878 [Fonticula alba]|eukprot:XP_009496014.1 hypothetical protein H696_03878 [Fonticula alba]